MAETDNNIFRRLEEEGKKKGIPTRLLKFYQRLFHIQSRTEKLIVSLPKLGLSSEAISKRGNQSLPLVNFDELALDWPLLQAVFAEITATFTDYTDLFGELPKSLSETKPQPSLLKKVVKAWFMRTRLPATIAVDNINEYLLLEAIIHATIRPFLVSNFKALINMIDLERWRHTYCPICGSRPDFAFLDKERGARFLVCSRCDTEWLFQRLQCPYCGTQNQDDLAYFTNDEGVYRLYVCERCHKYIKAIDLRHTKSEVLFQLERVLTLDLDRQAQEKGYKPDYSEVLTQM
ncbi:formate dehydrogenase accessory protein FdhE [Chloroflexota bacterium]